MSRPREWEPTTKSCKACGKSFVADSWYKVKKQRFCDHACRSDFFGKRRERKTKKIERPCKTCGTIMRIAPCFKKTKTCCSRECADKLRGKLMSGEKNHFWEGGDSAYWKRQARKRDDFTCQYGKCGKRNTGNGTHAHHKIPKFVGGSDDLSNLVTLCNRHHMEIERRIFVSICEKFPKTVKKLANQSWKLVKKEIRNV